MTDAKKSVDVTVKNKREVFVSGVLSVGGFDDDFCLLRTEDDVITVRGEGLSLLDLKSGDGTVRLSGSVFSVEYGPVGKKGFFGRGK